MISLYDYLGEAAGSRLGKQVAEYAKLRKAEFKTRKISIPTFKGEIMLYNKEFIDEFFQIQKLFQDNA